MKKYNKLVWILLLVFVVLQFFRPENLSNQPTKDLTNIPKEVNVILRNSCFDCHSSETNLRWYDKITPANFLVNSHIREGRKALDFSKWDSLAKPPQNSTIFYAINKVLSGEMPIPSYAVVHSSTKLNDDQIKVLKDYALSISQRKISEVPQINNVEQQLNNVINNDLKTKAVQASPNGLQYIPDYRNWKAISTTDRFDNGTLRIIFGNDVAVKAIQENKIDPWPDGTSFAKTAWKQNVDKNGNVSTGDFIQVEFMVKDSKKYAKTKGWGWGRWKGNDLKPYGKTPDFDKECIECHKPVANRDYVFTSPLYLISQLKKIQTQ
jgi:hypothetical protein